MNDDTLITITIQFWSVENTGWSGGISWFHIGGTETNPLRFKSFDEAKTFAVRYRDQLEDPSIKWRIVRTIIEKYPSKEITTRVWEELE